MQSVIIKKYNNKKLYIARGNTEPPGRVSTKDIVSIIQNGKDIKVVCKVTGEDLTVPTLIEALKHVEVEESKLLELIRNEK